MGPSDSFDPRTWTRGWTPSGRGFRRPSSVPAGVSRLGLGLAAAILIAGAVVAYATRIDPAAAAAEAPLR